MNSFRVKTLPSTSYHCPKRIEILLPGSAYQCHPGNLQKIKMANTCPWAPEVASLAFGNLSWDTPLLFTEDSENEAHPLRPSHLLFFWLHSNPTARLLGPSLPASCLLVLWGPPESPMDCASHTPLEHSRGCSPDGGGVGPSPQGLVLGWLSANCGPNSPGLGKPVGLGFPLSHLRKESPSSGSEEEQ